MNDETPKRESQPCSSFAAPVGETELHRAIICAECGWPFGEHGVRVWVDPQSQHAFTVQPPTIRTIEFRRVDPPAAPQTYRLDINHQVYEDDLPAGITKPLYDQWFAKSRIVDGVRMGPAIEAIAPAPADERDKALAKKVIKRYLDNDTNDFQLENEFIAALATVRAEERSACIEKTLQVERLLRGDAELASKRGDTESQLALLHKAETLKSHAKTLEAVTIQEQKS